MPARHREEKSLPHDSLFLATRMLPSAPMTRTALFCLFTLGLVACATPVKSPTPAQQTAAEPMTPQSAKGPAEASVEALPANAPVDPIPGPFEVARADFVRDTAARVRESV